MKKIGLLCLCLASLGLVGCFHIPDEDWLPSKNKVSTGDTQKDDEMDQALDSFMDGINIISSDWNELKNEGDEEITTEEGEYNEPKRPDNVDKYENTDNVQEDIVTEE